MIIPDILVRSRQKIDETTTLLAETTAVFERFSVSDDGCLSAARHQLTIAENFYLAGCYHDALEAATAAEQLLPERVTEREGMFAGIPMIHFAVYEMRHNVQPFEPLSMELLFTPFRRKP
jgi:hypothetical protein